MKYFLYLFVFMSMQVMADQRFETTGGFCHFVTPEGFQTANDDNEVFYANCLNSIRQNADGTGNGSTEVKVSFPVVNNASSAPFIADYNVSGPGSGVDCVMVDSNNTTYVTQDWEANYDYEDGLKPWMRNYFNMAVKLEEPNRYILKYWDLNSDNTINEADWDLYRIKNLNETIKYTVVCRNGAQQ